MSRASQPAVTSVSVQWDQDSQETLPLLQAPAQITSLFRKNRLIVYGLLRNFAKVRKVTLKFNSQNRLCGSCGSILECWGPRSSVLWYFSPLFLVLCDTYDVHFYTRAFLVALKIKQIHSNQKQRHNDVYTMISKCLILNFVL